MERLPKLGLVAEGAPDMKDLITELRQKTGTKMGSNLRVATAVVRAAMEGTLANVEINCDAFETGREPSLLLALTRR